MTAPTLIDTHCHPQMGQFSDDRELVIRRSLDAGIGLICVGTSAADSWEAVSLAEQYPHQPVWATAGIHPTDSRLAEFHPEQLAAVIKHPKLVAIGECGLDWFRLDPDDQDSRQLQIDVFEQLVLLAAQADLPLSVHTRDRNGTFDAYDKILSLLTRLQHRRFVMHCYSGDWARAECLLQLGGYLSFTGILAFPKSDIMQEVARRAPADRILVETDAPFLAPTPHRGKRNEPAYVRLVVEKLAELRGTTYSEMAVQTLSNAENFFGLEKTTQLGG